jgi:hypothetical protein
MSQIYGACASSVHEDDIKGMHVSYLAVPLQS